MKRIPQAPLSPPIPPGATALYVVFHPSRGRLRNGLARVPHSNEVRSFSPVVGVPSSLLLPVQDLALGLPLQIGIASVGEPLVFAFFVVVNGDGSLTVSAPSGDVCPDAGAPLISETVGAGSLSELLISSQSYADALAPSVATATDTQAEAKARLYFSTLESDTNPTLLPTVSPVRHDMDLVMPLLRRRARQRAILSKRDAPAVRRPLEHSFARATVLAVGELSGLQLDLARRCFPDGGSGIDRKAFEVAFELFANGDLRRKITPGPLTNVGYWVTQPSSAFYVFFAEFAFLAYECKVDRDQWLVLANVLARTQEIYFDVYRPRAGSPPFGFRDYRACNFELKSRWGQKKIDDLRTTTAGASIERLYEFAGKAASDAMRKFSRPW